MLLWAHINDYFAKKIRLRDPTCDVSCVSTNIQDGEQLINQNMSSVSTMEGKFLPNDYHFRGIEGSVLIVYFIQSFQHVFVSSFVKFPSPIMQAICKYIVETLNMSRNKTDIKILK